MWSWRSLGWLEPSRIRAAEVAKAGVYVRCQLVVHGEGLQQYVEVVPLGGVEACGHALIVPARQLADAAQCLLSRGAEVQRV